MLIGLSGVLALGTAEALLRALERAQVRALEGQDTRGGVVRSDIPGLHYTLKPGWREKSAHFNSLGLNMPERAVAKPPGVLRVVVVGDSVTQGVGADRMEDAYPNVLHDLLARPSVEVWNGGVGGYNAGQVLLFMQHVLPPYDPDLILYGFNFNDYWEANDYFHGQAALPPDQLARAAREGWLDQLKKFRVLLRLKDLYGAAHQRWRGYPPTYTDRKLTYPSWENMKNTLAEMRDEGARQGCGLAVLILPQQQFLFREDTQNAALADLTAWCEAQAITYLNLAPALRDHRAEAIYLPDGNHFTSRGYRLVAQQIAEWLQATPGLLPSASTP